MSDMKNIVKYIAISALMVPMVACDDLFEPAIENIKDPSMMEEDANYADAILGSAYILMPFSSAPVNDVATDDAVSNDIDNAWRRIAEGSWTSRTGVSNDNWRDRNASIQYCNLYLSNVDEIKFSANEAVNTMFRDRLKGEAYGLRALNMYYLLQNYGGRNAAGELLGVPVWRTPFDFFTDMNVKRESFAKCMEYLLSDVEEAVKLLPDEYKDGLAGSDFIKERYTGVFPEGKIDGAAVDRVFGAKTFLRMSGRIAKTIRAQAALLAASPAFVDGSGVTPAQAADYAAEVIGTSLALSATGHKWYLETGNGDNASANNAEVIWRDGFSENCDIETDNFPPSCYGKGRVNPTQNLVDAFPMANGYPISDGRGNYDATKPYEGRDSRLAEYIVYNGATGISSDNRTINTGIDAQNNDGINKESGYSTRTGYYLRKMLRQDVNPNGANTVKKMHYTTRFRYTQIYLAYAEMANEAWGPKGTGSHGYSAYNVIKAIRERAGICKGTTDPYLDECANAGKEKMAELIRNERRLELCFENVRFWDLRRWNSDVNVLNTTARGVEINGAAHKFIEVESRVYDPHMIYGPIPYNDVLRFSNLEQNKGW